MYRLRSFCFFFFQAEDGIRDLVRSRGLGDVYKRQGEDHHRLLADYLIGFVYFAGISVTAMFFSALQYLSLIHI